MIPMLLEVCDDGLYNHTHYESAAPPTAGEAHEDSEVQDTSDSGMVHQDAMKTTVDSTD